MQFLSLKEKCELARRVVEFSDNKMSVVVSGHTACGLDSQAEEINELSRCGADAVVLVSNRLDPHHQGDGCLS